MALHDPSFKYTSIQDNRTGDDVRTHKDSYNQGLSYIIALGNFVGGNFHREDMEEVDIYRKFLKFDGNVLHKPTPHVGTRYSLVFFTAVPNIVDHCQNLRTGRGLMERPLSACR